MRVSPIPASEPVRVVDSRTRVRLPRLPFRMRQARRRVRLCGSVRRHHLRRNARSGHVRGGKPWQGVGRLDATNRCTTNTRSLHPATGPVNESKRGGARARACPGVRHLFGHGAFTVLGEWRRPHVSAGPSVLGCLLGRESRGLRRSHGDGRHPRCSACDAREPVGSDLGAGLGLPGGPAMIDGHG